MNKILTLFFTVIMITTSYVSFAASPTAIPPKLQNFIKKFESEKDELQGGGIAILYKGQVIYKTTFGNQKGNTGLITSSTLFPLASVSKSVSATALALMVDQGTLSFDETFKLPYLKHPVNLRNILGHTTGYQFSGNSQIEQGMSRQKQLEVLKAQKPQCKPGKCYTYSNTIFGLVEEALNIKKLSLQSAIQNLRTALKTDGFQIVPLDSNMDIAYPHSNGKPLPFPPYYPKATPAAAGIFASLDGMIEFFKLSFGYRPDLISQKTLDSLHTPLISNRNIDKWNMNWPCGRDKIESYYGLGWRILKIKEHPGKDLIFHSGYISGINSFIGFIPFEEIGIVILTNQSPGVALQNGINFWDEFLR
jgi:beta-lactamase class C